MVRRSAGVVTRREGSASVEAVRAPTSRDGSVPNEVRERGGLHDFMKRVTSGRRCASTARCSTTASHTLIQWAVAHGYRDDNPANDQVEAALPKISPPAWAPADPPAPRGRCRARSAAHNHPAAVDGNVGVPLVLFPPNAPSTFAFMCSEGRRTSTMSNPPTRDVIGQNGQRYRYGLVRTQNDDSPEC